MANISGGKSRCEGWLPLQAAFGSRWKPFGRPVRDLAKKAHCSVEKAGKTAGIPAPFLLALGPLDLNLRRGIYEFTA